MKKKFFSAVCAVMMFVSLSGCGSSGDESKVKVYDEGEIGESGKYVLSSWNDMHFDKNSDGAVTAEEINEHVPDFALYPFGNGFMGFASEKEMEKKKYAVKIPISIDGEEYTVNMSFNEDQELVDWYIMFFQMWSNPNAKKTVEEWEASSKIFDGVFGSRAIDRKEKSGGAKNNVSFMTTWSDGGYTFDSTLSVSASSTGKATSAYVNLTYSRDE